jgi:predicted methyltransferase
MLARQVFCCLSHAPESYVLLVIFQIGACTFYLDGLRLRSSYLLSPA